MNLLEFHFFGGFSVSSSACGEKKTVTDKMVTSFKMWAMLEYLIINRKRIITSDELIDIIWPNQDISDPTNSLKALLFRIRQIFAKLGIENSKTLLSCKQRTFIWSKNVIIKTDLDEFDLLYKKINAYQSSINEDDIHSLISLYKGDVLPQTQSLAFANNLSVYYHSQFINLTNLILEKLLKDNKTQSAITLSAYALSLEAYDENLCRNNILALIKNGNPSIALKQFYQIKENFIEYLGEPPTSIVTDLYPVIIKKIKPEKVSLTSIKTDLETTCDNPAAFLCDYSTFKDIYRLKSRFLGKTGSSQIAMGAIIISNYDMLTISTPKFLKEIKALENHILLSLRKEDIITRVDSNKFLLLFSGADISCCPNILKRIVENYRKNFHLSDFILKYCETDKITQIKETLKI